MKNLTNSLLAAVALIAAGSASAQTVLKVEIPFAFRAGDTLMAPGNYRIVVNPAGSPAIRLHNDSARGSAMLQALLGDAAKDWVKAGVPKLGFECVESNCSLASVWTRGRDAMYFQRYGNARANAKVEIVTLDLKAE